MDQSFVGSIALFGFNFVPKGWASCNGQLLDISSNSALFSLLGTTYGGDGRTNFALPDLRGRVAIGYGQDPRKFGQAGGYAAVHANSGDTGSNDPTPTVQPYLVLNYCIALQGIFPARQ